MYSADCRLKRTSRSARARGSTVDIFGVPVIVVVIFGKRETAMTLKEFLDDAAD